ncbi:YdeI family protein [Muriicola sp. E247]|uniref:YdeI/OmpD-associated family protein n=1 Tax=Muriicola sp. E247 TaxID=3242730 RepID=UPI00352409B2
MSKAKIEAYFAREGSFKEGVNSLRALALQTEVKEELKWGAPVYTLGGKNVFGIMAFKSHFGIWFFNGCYLKDPGNVLENAQEGKTKAMRHWKFIAADDIMADNVLAYMTEAIENQKKGLIWKPEKKKKTNIPSDLLQVLKKDQELKKAFNKFTAYKQGEFCEYIETAKQLKTKQSRLEKIIPMIREGIGINDKYRKT